MKLIKKSVLTFTVAILLICFSITGASAANDLLISVNDITAKAGEEVQFVVELKNNPGIGIVTVNVGYDESVLTLKNAVECDFLKSFTFNYRVDSAKNPIVINGTMKSEKNDPESGLNKNDGDLVILTFVVAENAANGDYPISLTTKYCADDFGRPVKHTLKNGVLTIKNANEHQHKYTSSVTAPTCTEKGYTTYTCECGDTYKDDYVDATGNHIDNDKNYMCDVCGTELQKPPVINDKYSLGDINNDGKITASDARTILRTSAKLETLSESQLLVADIDSNGKISASDARIALRISAKLDSIDNYIKNEPPVDEPPVDEPPVDDRIDLAVYFGWHVSDFNEERPEFEFENGHAADGTVAIELDADGYICDIVDTGSSKYSIYGVCAETPYDEAKAIFESNGFVFEDDENAYNTEYGIGLWIFIGDEMTAYNIFSYGGEDYSENELFQYLNYNIEDVMADFDELEFYDETEDAPAHYYYDGIYFYVDEYDDVYMIDIAFENYYELYSITIYDSFNYVTEMLADSGLYYACFGEAYIIADNYYDGYGLYISFNDDGGVDYVSLYNSYYDLAEYHMYEVGFLLEMMPYLDKTDNLYHIPEFTFEVDEDGYVNAIILDSYNYCSINGIFIGMNGDDVDDALEMYGFTYNFTDEDGSVFYNNSAENLDMYVVMDDDNEVVCVCLY